MTKSPSRTPPPTPPSPLSSPDRTRYLDVGRRNGVEWLYFRRKGTRIALPGPVNSAAFIEAYDRAAASFETPPPRTGSGLHTLDDAVTHFLTTPAYTDLSAKTRADYRRLLDEFRDSFGPLRLAALDEAWIERLRRLYAAKPDEGKRGQPDKWNRLRSRMISVVYEYRIAHPKVLPANYWPGARRLKVTGRQSHQRWALPVIAAVIRAATPEFRALLVAYILTSQRGIDVTRFAPEQYDPAARTLTLTQKKTTKPIKLGVPDLLADAIAAMDQRLPDRLFVTPRGKPWTTARAQETLATLLRQLGLPRHTLHGLRATGPTFLTENGFSNRALRTLTGHDSDQNLEIYLQGADGLSMARPAQEAMAAHFASALAPGLGEVLNQRRFTGTTGRAAAKREHIANTLPTANKRPRKPGPSSA